MIRGGVHIHGRGENANETRKIVVFSCWIGPGSPYYMVDGVIWWSHTKTPLGDLGYSNSSGIRRLDLGALQGWAKKVRSQEAAGIQRVKTVHKYQDKSGKVRYKGSKHLKSSESESQLVVVIL